MIATIEANYGQRARQSRMVSATSTCSHYVLEYLHGTYQNTIPW
jgi:hypothetical protein